MNSPLPSPGAELAHYVSTAPFDPNSVEAMTDGTVKFLNRQVVVVWKMS